jgi:hypothetical protein
MAKRLQVPAGDENAELRRDITDLKDEVRVLRDILDEIRDELQWVTRNGVPVQVSHPVSPVLRQMALDPMAKDWGERLHIVRQASKEVDTDIRTAESVAPQTQATETPVSNPSKQRRLF